MLIPRFSLEDPRRYPTTSLSLLPCASTMDAAETLAAAAIGRPNGPAPTLAPEPLAGSRGGRQIADCGKSRQGVSSAARSPWMMGFQEPFIR